MLLQIISALPCIICLFWALMLLLRCKNRNRAKVCLSLFMFVTAILYACHWLYFNHLNSAVTDTIYLTANLSVYPMFLIYIRYLTAIDGIKTKLFGIMLIPAIAAIITAVTYILMPASDIRTFIDEYLYGNHAVFDSYAAIWQMWWHKLTPIIFAAEIVYVLVKGARRIVDYHNDLKKYYSSDNGRSLKTINRLLVVFIIISLLSSTVNIIGNAYFAGNTALIIVPSLLFGLMFVLLGTAGMRQNFSAEEFAAEMLTEAKSTATLSLKKRRELAAHITEALESKAYCNNDYKITNLATALGTNRTYVSQVINTDFGCNFSDLVNRYRVEHAKGLLAECSRKNEHPVMGAIFENSGFPSESSFYRIFKEQTGKTPVQFMEDCRADGNGIEKDNSQWEKSLLQP